MVRQVKRGTPAFTSGVCAGDEILALDGYRVKPSDSRKRLQQYDPGDEVKVLVARRQKLLTLRVSLGRRPPDSWQLEVDEQADEALTRIDHRFGNEGDFGRPERFSESFAIDPVQVE